MCKCVQGRDGEMKEHRFVVAAGAFPSHISPGMSSWCPCERQASAVHQNTHTHTHTHTHTNTHTHTHTDAHTMEITSLRAVNSNNPLKTSEREREREGEREREREREREKEQQHMEGALKATWLFNLTAKCAAAERPVAVASKSLATERVDSNRLTDTAHTHTHTHTHTQTHTCTHTHAHTLKPHRQTILSCSNIL